MVKHSGQFNTFRFAIIAAATLLLSGCDKPEIKACEAWIKDGLKAPSTYKRLSAESRLEPAVKPRAEHQVVLIGYEAQNSFGVPLASAEQCQFQTLGGGRLPSSALLDLSARTSMSSRDIWKLARGGAMGSEAREQTNETPPSCCLL
jgi:hypothetical protein